MIIIAMRRGEEYKYHSEYGRNGDRDIKIYSCYEDANKEARMLAAENPSWVVHVLGKTKSFRANLQAMTEEVE